MPDSGEALVRVIRRPRARRDDPLERDEVELAVVAPAVALQLLGQLQDRARRPRVLDAPAPGPLDAAPGTGADVLLAAVSIARSSSRRRATGSSSTTRRAGGGPRLPLLPGALFVLRVLVVEARRRLAGAP